MSQSIQRDAQLPPAASGGAAGGGEGMRILLVEDHPDTARVLTRVLRGAGYAVGVANSVAAAVDLAAAERFDLLVSDIGLPDGTGLDVMRHVRDRYGLRGIAISGFGMADDVARSLEAGFAEHLTKPVDLDRLEQAIGRAVSTT